jgi:SAM-dependent methyltransferase
LFDELCFDARKLRKEVFYKKLMLDEELVKIIGNVRSHNFLKNPSMQNAHLYLVEYLIAFSQKWFGNNNFKILDWGSGKCQVTYLCKKRGVDVAACDVEAGRGDSTFGQVTPIKDFMKIDVAPLKHEYKLPFENKKFDVVLSFGVLEHVANDQESLKEINRILKKNGLFFCFFLPYKYSYKQNLH